MIQKWEYHVEWFDENRYQDDVIVILDLWGSEGYELVSVTVDNNWLAAFFKRPLDTPDEKT